MLDKAKFVLSKSAALKQYDFIKQQADIVSYSLKTNIEVGHVLEESTDCLFSVHSLKEADEIKDKKRLWYFGQAWTEEELDCIFQRGICSLAVDNEPDLEILLKYIQQKRLKINLMLRMKLKENTIHTGKYFVYGMNSSQVNSLIPRLNDNENIDKLGIHFHRKTQNVSEWSLKQELEASLSREALESIDFIDIGGGIPGKYKNFKAEVIGYIMTKITELRNWLKDYNIKTIIEPGRAIAAPAVKLVATIKNIYQNNIIINCSVYNTAMDTFASDIRLLVEGELPDNQGQAYIIKGCTPCSMDIFRYRVFLKEPKVGDKISFLNAGAYNFATDFCGLEKLETEIVE